MLIFLSPVSAKCGKAAGEDEIRPEMLKALTREGILCLTRMSQVKLRGSTAKLTEIDKQVDYSDIQKRRSLAISNVRTTEGYHSLVCQGKYMLNTLKKNAEK